MSDDFLTREWADGHKFFSDQFAGFIGRVANTLRISLDRLNRYEFDAPWLRDQRRKSNC